MLRIDHKDNTRYTGSRFLGNKYLFNAFNTCETIKELQALYSYTSPYAYGVDQRVVTVMGMDLAFLTGDTIIWNGSKFVTKSSSFRMINVKDFNKGYTQYNIDDQSITEEEFDFTHHGDWGSLNPIPNYYSGKACIYHCPALYHLNPTDVYIDYALLGKTENKAIIKMPNMDGSGSIHYAHFTGDAKAVIASFCGALITLSQGVWDDQFDLNTYENCDAISIADRLGLSSNDDKIDKVMSLYLSILNGFYEDYYNLNGQNVANNTRPYLLTKVGSGVTDAVGKVNFYDIVLYSLPYLQHILSVPDGNDKILTVFTDLDTEDVTSHIPVPCTIKVEEITGPVESTDTYLATKTASPAGIQRVSDNKLVFSDNTVVEQYSLGDKTSTTYAAIKNSMIASDKTTLAVDFVPAVDANGDVATNLFKITDEYTRVNSFKITARNNFNTNPYDEIADFVSGGSYKIEREVGIYYATSRNYWSFTHLYTNVSLSKNRSNLLTVSAAKIKNVDISNGDGFGEGHPSFNTVTADVTVSVHPLAVLLQRFSKYGTTPYTNAKTHIPNARIDGCMLQITDNQHVDHHILVFSGESILPNLTVSRDTTEDKKVTSYGYNKHGAWPWEMNQRHNGSSTVTVKTISSPYNEGPLLYVKPESQGSSTYNGFYLPFDYVTDTWDKDRVYAVDLDIFSGSEKYTILYNLTRDFNTVWTFIKSHIMNANEVPDYIGKWTKDISSSSINSTIAAGKLTHYPYIENVQVMDTFQWFVSSYNFNEDLFVVNGKGTCHLAFTDLNQNNTVVSFLGPNEVRNIISISASDAQYFTSYGACRYHWHDSEGHVSSIDFDQSLRHAFNAPITFDSTISASPYARKQDWIVSMNAITQNSESLDFSDLAIPGEFYQYSNGDIQRGYLTRNRIRIVDSTSADGTKTLSVVRRNEDSDFSDDSLPFRYRSAQSIGYTYMDVSGRELLTLSEVLYQRSVDYMAATVGVIVTNVSNYKFTHALKFGSFSSGYLTSDVLMNNKSIDYMLVKDNSISGNGYNIVKLYITTNKTSGSSSRAVEEFEYLRYLNGDVAEPTIQTLPYTGKAALLSIRSECLPQDMNHNYDDYSATKSALLHRIYSQFDAFDDILDEVITNKIDTSFASPSLYQMKAQMDATNLLAMDMVVDTYNKVHNFFSNLTDKAGSLITHLKDQGSLFKSKFKNSTALIRLPSIDTISSDKLDLIRSSFDLTSVSNDSQQFILGVKDSTKKIKDEYKDSFGNLTTDAITQIIYNDLQPSGLIEDETDTALLNLPSVQFNSPTLPKTSFDDITKLFVSDEVDIAEYSNLVNEMSNNTLSHFKNSDRYVKQLVVPSSRSLSDICDDLGLEQAAIEQVDEIIVEDPDPEDASQTVQTSYRIINVVTDNITLLGINNILKSDENYHINAILDKYDNTMIPFIDINTDADLHASVETFEALSAESYDETNDAYVNSTVTPTVLSALAAAPTNVISSVDKLNQSINDTEISDFVSSNYDEVDDHNKRILAQYIKNVSQKVNNVQSTANAMGDLATSTLTAYCNGVIEDVANDVENSYYAAEEQSEEYDTDGNVIQSTTKLGNVSTAIDSAAAELDQSLAVISDEAKQSHNDMTDIINNVKLNVAAYKTNILTRMASSQVVNGLSSSLSLFVDNVQKGATTVKGAISSIYTRLSNMYKSRSNSFSDDAKQAFDGSVDMSKLYNLLGLAGKKLGGYVGLLCYGVNSLITKSATAVRNFIRSTIHDGQSISYRLSGFETLDVAAYQKIYTVEEFEADYPSVLHSLIQPFAMRYTKKFTISVQYSQMFVFYTYDPEQEIVVVRHAPKIYDVAPSSKNDFEIYESIATAYRTTANVINYISKRMQVLVPQLFSDMTEVFTGEHLNYTEFDKEKTSLQLYSTYISLENIDELEKGVQNAPYAIPNATADTIIGWSSVIFGAGAAVTMAGGTIPGLIMMGVGAVGMIGGSIYEQASSKMSIDEIVGAARSDVTYGNAMISNSDLYELITVWPSAASEIISHHIEIMSLRNLIHTGDGNYTSGGIYIPLGFSRDDPKLALHLRTDIEILILKSLKLVAIGAATTGALMLMSKVTKSARLNKKMDKLNAQAWALPQNDPKYLQKQTKIQKRLRKKSAKLDGMSAQDVSEVINNTDISLPSGSDISLLMANGLTLMGKDDYAEKVRSSVTQTGMNSTVSDIYVASDRIVTAVTALETAVGDSETGIIHQLNDITAGMQNLSDVIGEEGEEGSMTDTVMKVSVAAAGLAVSVAAITTAVEKIKEMAAENNLKKLAIDGYIAAGFDEPTAKALANAFLLKFSEGSL